MSQKIKDSPFGEKKAEQFNTFIKEFNRHLVPFEDSQYHDHDETLPSVHVIGVPRSGTTLLTQLICSYLDVGYINNLIARFWRAPVTGIRISREVLDEDYRSSLQSDFGKTSHVQEPHEFNFFWAEHLGYDEYKVKSKREEARINWPKLALALNNIIHTFGKPVAFKSFMLGWHAYKMQQHLKKTCFVWIKRDPLDNALSLLETREQNFGSKHHWSALKPENYESLKDLSPHKQVAAQVYYLEQTYRKQLEQIPENNYLVLRYEDVCINPLISLQKIQQLVNDMGGSVRMKHQNDPGLKPSERIAESSEDYEKVQDALKTFYS